MFSSHVLLVFSSDLVVRYNRGAEWFNEAFKLFFELEKKINRFIVDGDVNSVLASIDFQKLEGGQVFLL